MTVIIGFIGVIVPEIYNANASTNSNPLQPTADQVEAAQDQNFQFNPELDPTPVEPAPQVLSPADLVLQHFHPTKNPFANFAPAPVNTSFESQSEEEKILLLLRQHPVVFARAIGFSLLFLILPIVIGSFPFLAVVPTHLLTIFVFGWYLVTFGFMLQRFLDWFFNVYIVTDERVVDVSFDSLFYRHTSYALLSKIEDVEAGASGFSGTIFDYGKIEIQTAGASEQFAFENVPHPMQVAKFINELLISIQEKGGG